MAVLRKQFHQHERGMGDEDWHYLAHDTETGRVFVVHEWSHRRGDRYEPGSAHIELDAFLARRGTAQDQLRQLIATLIPDDPDA